jgi:hypothetical protein
MGAGIWLTALGAAPSSERSSPFTGTGPLGFKYLNPRKVNWLRRAENLGGKIYIFGEASIEALKTQARSSDPRDLEKAVGDSVLKITLLRTIVDEKHVKRIFVEEGSILARAIIVNFQDADPQLLHGDPKAQRAIRAIRWQIAESIALKEKLMQEFAGIGGEPAVSGDTTGTPSGQERYTRVLEERMKGLTPVPIEELSQKLEETRAAIEVALVEEINDGFVDPSLVVCGIVHLSPSKEEIPTTKKSGRMPELLKEKGYDVEVLFLEPEKRYT